MIDEFNIDRTGWARFSDDRKMRFRLARSLTECGRLYLANREYLADTMAIIRVVFVMLNPSTADAFKLDPTVKRCVEFARRWGADVLEVVNLFAVRSPKPRVLYDGARVAAGHCGDYSHAWRWSVGADQANDLAIWEACAGANRVIAAWGNHGELADRGLDVAADLARVGVRLESLRLSKSGAPMHPLARGKNRIPYDVTPEVFA